MDHFDTIQKNLFSACKDKQSGSLNEKDAQGDYGDIVGNKWKQIEIDGNSELEWIQQ